MKSNLTKVSLSMILAASLISGCGDNNTNSNNTSSVKESATKTESRFIEGVHYEKLSNPLIRSNNTVTEIFSFTCPHCFTAEKVLMKDWKETAKDTIEFEIVHSTIWEDHAKVYYTLIAMDETQAIYPYFEAVQAKEITDDKSLKAFLSKNSVNLKPYELLLESNLVKSKIDQAKKLEDKADVKGVPTFIVAGKYKVIGGNSYEEIKQITEFLINKK